MFISLRINVCFRERGIPIYVGMVSLSNSQKLHFLLQHRNFHVKNEIVLIKLENLKKNRVSNYSYVKVLLQWCIFENQPSLIYEVNWHFSRRPDRY